MARCPWGEGLDLYRGYHGSEWGIPLYDERSLFALLILEGAQAGLSWATILKKRENYRRIIRDRKNILRASPCNPRVFWLAYVLARQERRSKALRQKTNTPLNALFRGFFVYTC